MEVHCLKDAFSVRITASEQSIVSLKSSRLAIDETVAPRSDHQAALELFRFDL